MKDALIIGQGIAGSLLSFALAERGWTIDVVDHVKRETASKIASGLYNPLVLKRRRVVWHAHPMINEVSRTYLRMQELTGKSFFDTRPVWEVLPDTQTENDWVALSDKPLFEPFIGKVIRSPSPSIRADKVGEVRESGRVNVSNMINAWQSYLRLSGAFTEGQISPDSVSFSNGRWIRNGKEYHRIFWCTGFAGHHPHFGKLPFSPTKGEVLIVRSPELKLDHILHGKMFIMPLGDDLYKVGATYSWDYQDDRPTEAGLEQISVAWKQLVSVPFEVIEHQAGIRPNVKDRKPIIGESATHPRSYIFNGLGSRGILMAPWLAKTFAEQLDGENELPKEVRFNRFTP